MGPSDARILSRPHRVVFAGFESTTTRLQQAGWELAVEQSFLDMRIRLALRFEPARLYLMADAQHLDFFRYASYALDEPLTFHIRQCASHMTVQLMETSFAFQPIDAVPQFTEAPRKSIEDFGIFAAPLARTEQILIEPQSVAQCLEQIRKLQAPELAAIRERNRRRNDEGATVQPIPRQTFHAQVLSLAA
jgi:hypothetical protein